MNGTVLGVSATPGAAAVAVITPWVAPLVSFQNVLVVACELCPAIGMGTCWSCHCTVGCTPTWLIPVVITSGCSASIWLKIGVKSVVSGLNRMWSSTLSPALGRHSRYFTSSGLVQAASSLMTTVD